MVSPKMGDADVLWHIKLIVVLILLFVGLLVAYPLFIRKLKKPLALSGWALLLAGLAFSILYMLWQGLGPNGFLD